MESWRAVGVVWLSLTVVVCIGPTTSHCEVGRHGKVWPLLHKSSGSTSTTNSSYVVILDSGSTGTRIHVFRFNTSLHLLYIGDDFEYYSKVTPGLSSYAENPEEGAEALLPLLRKAESVVPEDYRSLTPVRLGATAGLRSLDSNSSQLILQAVRNVLKTNTSFKVDSVAILSGNQEGYYIWVTVNYLLNKMGEEYSKTIGVVDLGGGSVQMAYAISEAAAAKAPASAPNGDPYVTKIYLGGTLYYIYVHSYLNYGKEVSRTEILKLTGDSDNPCVLTGFNGSYVYNNVEYKASAPANGSSFSKCRNTVLKLFNTTTCAYKNCTFGGVWNGGGGPGQKNLYLATNFYYLAVESGLADPNKTSSEVRVVDLKIMAELACKTTYEEANSTFPLVEEDVLPYVCMDLVYQYSLLVDGFGLDPWQVVTVVDQIYYEGSYLDASWPLGNAIEAISSSSKFERLLYVV